MKRSQIVIMIAAAIIVAGSLYFYNFKRVESPVPVPEIKIEAENQPKPLSIKEEEIKEQNFTGKKPVIEGESKLAQRARDYVEDTVSEFKKRADKEVPPMSLEYGTDSSAANYTIDIKAEHRRGEGTESVVMNVYTYTGGARGNSSYRVIAASSADGELLSLGDIIKDGQETAFTNFVKNKLKNWKLPGSNESAVFADVVDTLTFSSFQNWSLDNKNLSIYFSQDEIGPGALGPVEFKLPVSEIKQFLTEIVV